MQRSDSPEDVRVQRTQKLLKQALFELTVEKGFAAVTVRDIANRAQVNRSTFYRHYLDKYDLLNRHLEELQALTTQAALAAEQAGSTSHQTIDGQHGQHVPAGLLIVIRHVQEYAEFYRVMLGKQGDPAFTHRFRQLTESRYRYLFSRFGAGNNPQSAPVEMKLSYISAASVGAICWWLEHNQPYSAEHLAIWLGQLSMTSSGINMLTTP